MTSKTQESERAAWVIVFLASLTGSAARVASNGPDCPGDVGDTVVTAAKIATAATEELRARGFTLMETFK